MRPGERYKSVKLLKIALGEKGRDKGRKRQQERQVYVFRNTHVQTDVSTSILIRKYVQMTKNVTIFGLLAAFDAHFVVAAVTVFFLDLRCSSIRTMGNQIGLLMGPAVAHFPHLVPPKKAYVFFQECWSAI